MITIAAATGMSYGISMAISFLAGLAVTIVTYLVQKADSQALSDEAYEKSAALTEEYYQKQVADAAQQISDSNALTEEYTQRSEKFSTAQYNNSLHRQRMQVRALYGSVGRRSR